MSDLRALLGSYQALLSQVDTWFSRCSLAAGDAIACRRGCSGCCRGLFDITLLDAFLLKDGFDRLSSEKQQPAEQAARNRILQIQQLWPDFNHPFLLNLHPEEEWEQLMPEEDETPCALLGADGLCLVYEHRPMTCRLHGVPMVDESGEVLFDEWCSMNFTGRDPLSMQALQAPFNTIFYQEQLLFREFTRQLLGQPFNELDTLIPAAVLLDFDHCMVPEQLWNQTSS